MITGEFFSFLLFYCCFDKRVSMTLFLRESGMDLLDEFYAQPYSFSIIKSLKVLSRVGKIPFIFSRENLKKTVSTAAAKGNVLQKENQSGEK